MFQMTQTSISDSIIVLLPFLRDFSDSWFLRLRSMRNSFNPEDICRSSHPSPSCLQQAISAKYAASLSRPCPHLSATWRCIARKLLQTKTNAQNVPLPTGRKRVCRSTCASGILKLRQKSFLFALCAHALCQSTLSWGSTWSRSTTWTLMMLAARHEPWHTPWLLKLVWI